jgi:hypothetical protein
LGLAHTFKPIKWPAACLPALVFICLMHIVAPAAGQEASGGDMTLLRLMQQYMEKQFLGIEQVYQLTAAENPSFAPYIHDSLKLDPGTGERTRYIYGFDTVPLNVMLTADSVKMRSNNLTLYLSFRQGFYKFALNPKDPFPQIWDPLPLVRTSNGGHVIEDLLSRLSFVSGRSMNRIRLLLVTPYDSAVRRMNLFGRHKSADTTIFSFKDEVLMGDLYTKAVPLEFANWLEAPRALVSHTADIGSETNYYSLSPEQRLKIQKKKKAEIERLMVNQFGHLKDRFVFDDDHKFSFLSVPGLISKKSNQWELVELVISYIPLGEKYGTLVLTFQGEYETADPRGKGPDVKVIRHDGHNLEDEYMDQIRGFMYGIQNEIEEIISK